jgi:hypothetical protein
MMTAEAIARALGGRRSGRSFVCRCPAHEDRSPSLSITEGERAPLLKCFAGCDSRAVIAALERRGLWPATRLAVRVRPPLRKRPVAPPDQRREHFVRTLWEEACDPFDTPAHDYLLRRGLGLDNDLRRRVVRYHPRCPWEDRRVPALLAAFRRIEDPADHAAPAALLRIAITSDGKKAFGADSKKMLGPVAGCVIKLDRDEDVTLAVGLAEGLETGLAVRATGWRPMWAAGSAGAIAAGTAAASECARRWQAAGREVFIRTPRSVDADWADGP